MHKQVFYKLEHNANVEPFAEMQKWNILTEIAQRVDEKNWVICIVIIFTPRVMKIDE